MESEQLRLGDFEMSMISEQAKKIRSVAGICAIEVKKTLLEAADTIEALSAKLAAANMERSDGYYGGGWIACDKRLPTKEECIKNDNRFILDDGNRRYEGCFDYIEKRFVRFNCDGMKTNKRAIAWCEMPEPYRQ